MWVGTVEVVRRDMVEVISEVMFVCEVSVEWVTGEVSRGRRGLAGRLGR